MPVTIRVPMCDFVIFGGTDDLAVRQLLPALYRCDRDGRLSDETRVIVTARAGLDDAGYRDEVRGELLRFVDPADSDEIVVQRFLNRLSYVSLDASDGESWPLLVDRVRTRSGGIRVFYLACAPSLFGPICARLNEQSLVDDQSRVVLEKPIGVGTRGGYYDTSGALRDMVQNHLLQLLCLVAMEPPTHVHRESVRDEKLKVLQALSPLTPADVDAKVVAGQCGPGLVVGAPVPTYTDEIHKGDSRTETFVAIKAEVRNWRWAGVPFYLRTGKPMDHASSEIVMQFKSVPHPMFLGSEGTAEPNRLVLALQPDGGMRLHMMAREPGPGGIRLRPVSLDLSYAHTFQLRLPDAYERLLMDVVQGNTTLFMRRDEVEAAWRWVEPILTRWVDATRPPNYAAGTNGQTAATSLIDRDNRARYEGQAA